MRSALVIVGHGSRDPEGVAGFHDLIKKLQERKAGRIIEGAFLEFAHPVVSEAIERCVARGADEIVMVPGTLVAGGHAKNDIPSEIHEARRQHPHLRFAAGKHLHIHPKILALCAQRIAEAEAKLGPLDRKETVLLVVGRGTSDPDANGDIHKVARMLWEGLGFGWAESAFSGVTNPLVPDALRKCAMLGFKRVLVLPYFLFTGVLEKRIRTDTAAASRSFPDVEFSVTHYLDSHPSILDVLEERALQAVAGSPNMNCELCKYRVQIVGFEPDFGKPQEGHHHHVRGILSGPSHKHPHEHPHVAGADHVHVSYEDVIELFGVR